MKILRAALVCVLAISIPSIPLSNPNALAQSSQSIKLEMLRSHVVKLADDRLEGRGGGYPGERKAADYIASAFKRIKLTPFGDQARGRRSYFQEFKFQTTHPVVPFEVRTSRNVLGLIEGTDAALKNEVVVIGAHYDGQGRVGQADPIRMATDEAKVASLITNGESDAAGLGAEESALKVSGVVAGLPSAEAGLKEGDLIVEFAKRRFRRDDTLAALMALHREALQGKFGNRLPVVVLRNSRRRCLLT